MKYSLSEIIKDLLAKIPVLENRINTLSTQITNINNNSVVKKVSDSAPEGNTLTLVEGVVETDGFRIIVGDEGKDNLYVSFDTTDNGDEKLQFRQYSGGGGGSQFIGTPLHTAVILGRNGETTFPVSVTAPKFVGSLKGNADTATNAIHAGTADSATNAASATKLQVARTLALSGKATGTTTFDGTANANINVTSVNADTASKLSNPRTISLDGNATGSANFDGSNNVTINTTVNQAAHADSAVNADTLDGYHASDLLSKMQGNKAPVMTDIFDRAGTIDLTAMNATDKANNKAKINKSYNSLQNIWNTSTGIAAYGGDIDMANGYHKGTLKLTQSYKNFDKILVVGTNDDGNIVFYKLWDVYELIFAFSHSFRFPLYNQGAYWTVYGSVRTGTATNYVLSTDTIWSCYDQGAGIIAIYGIKY